MAAKTRIRLQPDHRIAFLQGFLKSPKQVGSIIPSSRFLERRDRARGRDRERASLVVELGPGTGGTTRALLRAMSPKARLLAIEIDPRFVALLRRMPDPRLIVHEGSAAEIEAALRQHELPAPDVILSGIPFSTMTRSVGEQILRSVYDALEPGGLFVAYQVRDRVESLGRRVFGRAQVQTEILNMPPMRVYRWQKQKPPRRVSAGRLVRLAALALKREPRAIHVARRARAPPPPDRSARAARRARGSGDLDARACRAARRARAGDPPRAPGWWRRRRAAAPARSERRARAACAPPRAIAAPSSVAARERRAAREERVAARSGGAAPPSLSLSTTLRARSGRGAGAARPPPRGRAACARARSRSATSSAKVFSSLYETGSRQGSTSRRSSPRASRATARPQAPSSASSRAGSAAASAPMRARSRRLRGAPAPPGRRPRSDRRAAARGTRARPRAAPRAGRRAWRRRSRSSPPASPARCRPSRRVRSRRAPPRAGARASARGGPNRRSVPVMSRKASSSERPSTSGVKRRKISKIRARLARVLRHLAGQEDALGAEAACEPGGLRRVHAEAARLVARRRDDAARPRPAHDHGPAAQLRTIALLDRRVEGVHVGVQDHAHRAHQSTAVCWPAFPATEAKLWRQRSAQTGGLAAGVRWDLADLYAGPDDPRIEADLAQALARAQRFAERHRGGVAQPLRRRAGPRAGGARGARRARGPPRQLRAAALRRRHQRAAPRSAAPARAGARDRDPQRAGLLRARVGGARRRAPPARCSRLRRSRGAGTSSHRCAATGRTCCAEPEEKLVEELANTGRRAFCAPLRRAGRRRCASR